MTSPNPAADLLRSLREASQVTRRLINQPLPVTADDLPLKAMVEGIADQADSLGLRWRLVTATVSTPGTGGEMRVTVDNDNVALPAVSMIGRVPVGARVFVILSPPAGVHICGFMGYDFPASAAGEAIGRPRMIVLGTGFNNTTTTLQPVPGLSFEAVANAVYEVRLRAAPAAQAADDYKIAWSVPSGAGVQRYHLFPPASDAGNTDPRQLPSFASYRAGNGTSANGAGSTLATPAHWEDGYVKMGATPGTVAVTFAKLNASASGCTLLSDSYLIVQRYR